MIQKKTTIFHKKFHDKIQKLSQGNGLIQKKPTN